jgi:2-hydroxychromene-2-carboxylate isomerase
MSMRVVVSRSFSRVLTSPTRRRLTHRLKSLPRRLGARPAVVDYFHDDADPYSHLLASVLPLLQSRYRIELRCHRVSPPDAAAAPDAARLQVWSQRDARRLAAHHALPPDFAAIDRLPWFTTEPLKGSELRQRLGHYLGATLNFEGEWYWGIDRLHYLESRLRAEGLGRDDSPALIAPPPQLKWAERPARTAAMPALHFFCSLRSPYTWLSVERAHRLATHYGAALQLRFVLPMVMRGLPVGFAKRKYILLDAKREAESLGLPFGDVVDPVGLPVERGLAVLQHAIQHGIGVQYLESFLRGVFAEGIDAGDLEQFASLGTRAGLTRDAIDNALRDDGWRAVAERNRADMLSCGLWGVPSFRVDGCEAVWGQDRLWMIEDDLCLVGAR